MINNHTKIINYINLLIGVVCIALLLVPYSTVNEPTFDGGKLVDEYIFNTTYLLFLFIPFYVLWGISLLVKKRAIKLLLISVLLLLVNVYFLFSCFALFFAAQDYIPRSGLFIADLLYPLVLVYLILVYIKK